ncbi:cytochrome c-type biogenesis protein [Sneathiella limimaris]|uniref:cytochrome c-type biogenesis protein n=1 Tax=Sneathiella limimaris TaxID=1964213 RepID=UPI00146F3C84|nr:cytochrome c-type biogenesis protein [Sneathiella limimaris]
MTDLQLYKRLVSSLLITLSVFVLFVSAANAIFVEERLEDPKLEERARDIADGIRCLVCQNQSIMDSNADLAKDLRSIVRERVAAGDSDDQVKTYLVSRYGDWVLLDPPFKPRTLLLWLAPVLFFFIGAVFMWQFLRRKSKEAVADGGISSALTPEEEQKLKTLLEDDAEEKKR